MDASRRAGLVPAGCAIAIAALAAWWMAITPQAQLRETLRVGQFWFLEGLFAVLLVATAIAGRHVMRMLNARDRWLFVGLVSLAAALVLIAPRTNRIFYDEQIYQAIGQNLSDLHRAQMCNDGTVEYGVLQCWRHEYNKQPYGYPHLLSVGYRWFGRSVSLAHWLNLLVSGATAGVIFLLVFLLTRDRLAGTFAALVFMLLPEQLRWSHSAAVEPSAAFACALAMLATAAFVESRSTAALAWMIAASSWATCFRPEAVLILPVIAAVVLRHAREEIGRPRFLWVAVLWIVLLLPTVAHLAAVRNESWGSSGGRFSLPFFLNNLRTNTAFYAGDPRFPAVVTLLALAGVGVARAATMPLGLWFGAFWGVFLFFYAGSYDYGADVRFSLMSYPPLAALAGIGMWRLLSRPGWQRSRVRRATAVGVAALAFQFAWYLPWTRAVGEEAWGARADVEFARDIAATLPANAVVLTHNPGMFHLWGVNAAQLSLATTEPAFVTETLPRRYAGGVYLHWNFWCNVSDPIQRGFCDRALATYPGEVVQQRQTRDYRFAFYRLAPPDPQGQTEGQTWGQTEGQTKGSDQGVGPRGRTKGSDQGVRP
jgi:hypothetical protein